MGDFDVTGNIRVIEKLKTDILSGVAELYGNMCSPSGDAVARTEILADLVILTYTLSNRLGVSPAALDNKITNKLRLGVLDEHEPLHADIQALIGHINRKRG